MDRAVFSDELPAFLRARNAKSRIILTLAGVNSDSGLSTLEATFEGKTMK